MKTAFLMTTHDHTTNVVTMEVVEFGTRATLLKKSFEGVGSTAIGNRINTHHWARARGEIARWCLKNDVLLENAPSMQGGAH